MEKDYYYPDDSHHYEVPRIDTFSHFYVATKQNKQESLDKNPKTSQKCKPFEWIKHNKKNCILLIALVILALVVAIASKRKRNFL